MFSLAVWRRDWWKEQLVELSFWAGLYIILTSRLGTLDLVIGVVLIGLNDQVIGDFLKRHAPSLAKGIDATADAAKKAADEASK